MYQSRKPHRAETIEYRGIIFRRYPQSLRWPDRMYYTPSSPYRHKGVDRLHQEIWKDANGPIPPGHHIHHRDGNPLNNALDNLACVPGSQHNEYHMSLLSPAERARRRAWFHHIRPSSSNWHRSEAGREWHHELGQLSWHGRGYATYRCHHCGALFESRANDTHAIKFCSGACKSAARRAAGKDQEERICVICGKRYQTNRYARSATCSRSCRVSYSHRKRREANQLPGGLQSGG